MKQNSIQKILQAVAYKGESRPVLQDILYKGGNVYATDSHQLVRFEGVTDNLAEFKINSISLLPDFEHNYPDVTYLFNAHQTLTSLELSLDQINSIVQFLKPYKKTDVTITIKRDQTIITAAGGAAFNLTIGSNGSDLVISANAAYLLNCLGNLKGYQKEYDPAGIQKVVINFGKRLETFEIKYLKMTFIISPVRTY